MLTADANRDGAINQTDVQILGGNVGFAANRPPVITPGSVKTHADRQVPVNLASLAADAEGDPVFFRVISVQNGSTRLGQDGQALLFLPALGFTGTAGFQLVADDGFHASAPALVSVTVSAAPLVNIDFVNRAPRLDPGGATRMELRGDFADEKGVTLPASYLTFRSTEPSVVFVSPTGHVSARSAGTATLLVSSHGIQAATVVAVRIPEERAQQLLYVQGLNTYPQAVSLASGGTTRQLIITSQDKTNYSAASTGTTYYSSNAQILDVSADGLIASRAPGVATVTVINGPAEKVIPIRVEVPQLGPVVLGSAGGVVQGTDGSLVAVPPGLLKDGTTVSIAPIAQTNLPLAVPAGFEFAAAFRLEFGEDTLSQPVQLAIPVPSTIAPGTKVFLLRESIIPDETGAEIPLWLQVESAVVGTDGFARTTSPPYPGVPNMGNYVMTVTPGGFTTASGEVHLLIPGVDIAGAPPMVVATAGGALGVIVGAAFNGLLDGSSPFDAVLNLKRGRNVLTIYQIPAVGLPTKTTLDVEVRPNEINTFVVTMPIAAPPLPESEPPRIDFAHVEFTDQGAELVLTGQRFTNPPGSRSPRGLAPQDVIVTFRNPDGQELVAHPLAATSTLTDLHVPVPQGVILGLATITASRPGQVRTRSPGSSVLRWQDQEVPSNAVTLRQKALDNKYLFVADANSGDVAVINADPKSPAFHEVIARIPVGKPGPGGFPVRAAVTPDGTRTYVTRRHAGDVVLVDALALQEIDVDPSTPRIDRIALPDGAFPFGIAIDPRGEFAYVSDGRQGLVYVLDVNPSSPTFHRVRATIRVEPAPQGLIDLTLDADGKRLYVTAPGRRTGGTFTSPQAPGSILVIDTDPADAAPERGARYHKQIGTIAEEGQEPYDLTATSDPHVLAFTNRLSDFQGFGVIRADQDRNTWTVSYTSLTLGSIRDSFDVNNAAGVAVLPDKSYAFVLGYNKFILGDTSHDPDQDQLKPGGSNVGIIKDPFGPKPKLVGATPGIPHGFADSLLLSPDSKYLYASYSATNAVFIFDVKQMIEVVQDPGGADLGHFAIDNINFLIAASDLPPPAQNPPQAHEHTFGQNGSFMGSGTPAAKADYRLFPIYWGERLVQGGTKIEIHPEEIRLDANNQPVVKERVFGVPLFRNPQTQAAIADPATGLLKPNLHAPLGTGKNPKGMAMRPRRVSLPGDPGVPSAPGAPGSPAGAEPLELLTPLGLGEPNQDGIDGPDVVEISTRVDRLNGEVAVEGGALYFLLQVKAKVTLLLDDTPARDLTHPLDITDVVKNNLPQPPLNEPGPPLPVFQDIELNPGLYRLVLAPQGPLSLPGAHRYKLKAVTEDDDTFTDQGKIIHVLKTYESFPVGHTIVKGVDLWDGHLTVSSQDVFIPGRGLPLDFSRTYSSAGSSSEGPLGAGWTHNYNVRLVQDENGNFTVIGGEGSGNRFRGASVHLDPQKAALFGLPANQQAIAQFYEPQIGHHSILVRPDTLGAPGEFDFYTKGHVRYHFALNLFLLPFGNTYSLQYIEERNGNRVNLYYQKSDPRVADPPPNTTLPPEVLAGRLPTALKDRVDHDAATLDVVTDSSGRALLLSYDYGIFMHTRLKQVKGYDPAGGDLRGLRIDYRYDDAWGNLTSVTRAGVPANESRTETYVYSIDNTIDPHNLRFYTDPNLP